MDNMLRKGRALQLTDIDKASVKVTVGFKCTGKEKIALASEAHQSEMTLSEYVEYLVASRHEQNTLLIKAVTKMDELKSEQQRLSERIAFYENNVQLQSLLKTHLGKTIRICDATTGLETSITINHVADIFNVMVNSFKTNRSDA